MNPKYERREGEGDYEYGLRLIETKVEQHPDDLDWQDIVEATGIDCHRDSLRKAAYDQRREFYKLVDKKARGENLEERLLEAASLLNEARPLTVDKPGDLICGDAEAVIVFADWHYGMVTDNIWERYDTEICRQRVTEVIRRAIERIRLHHCRRLHILLLGDMAHGAIHTSARVASEELTCDQVMQVSELLAETICILADEVEETVVHATYGNHLRTVQNKGDSIHADNMERLIPWWLKQRLRDRGDVEFPEAEYYEFLYVPVCGYNICAAHGDLDNVKNAGKILNTLFIKKYARDIDYVLLADKHHKEEFEELRIESMIVPSLCGSDEYANSRRLYSTPAQLMMVFRPHVGADARYQFKFD